MKKRIIFTIIGLLIVFGAIFGFKAYQIQGFISKMSHYAPPPQSVSTATAKSVNWQPYISATGSLQAVEGVDLSAQVAGIVSKINFHSGEMVKKGQPLLYLDKSVLTAQEKNDTAQLKLAEITYQRNLKIFKTKTISAATLDTSKAQLQEAQAALEKTQAQINQMTITAPFDGKIGIRLVNMGQYLAAGTAISNLQSINPMDVLFSIPGQDVGKLYVGQKVNLTVPAYGNRLFSGKITAVDARINSNSRSIAVKASIPNPDGKLVPGMFAQVDVLLPAQKDVISLPQTAVTYTLYGDSVFLVKKEKTKAGKENKIVQRVSVTVGQRKGSNVSVLKGIKAGEEVVTSGQLKLQNGTHVVVNNKVELN